MEIENNIELGKIIRNKINRHTYIYTECKSCKKYLLVRTVNNYSRTPVTELCVSCAQRSRNGMNTEDRFWEKVKKTNDCWIWMGAKNIDGYAVFNNKSAGKYSYELKNGEISDKNLELCHKCDNPSCVNPDHLFLGTHRENEEDKIKKGRLKGENNGYHTLSEKDVISIRKRYKTESIKSIFNDYKGIISISTLNSICYNYSWKHIVID